MILAVGSILLAISLRKVRKQSANDGQTRDDSQMDHQSSSRGFNNDGFDSNSNYSSIYRSNNELFHPSASPVDERISETRANHPVNGSAPTSIAQSFVPGKTPTEHTQPPPLPPPKYLRFSSPSGHPPFVATSSLPPFITTSSHPPFLATSNQPPFAATSSHPPFAATSSHPPFAATSSHPPFAATSSHLPPTPANQPSPTPFKTLSVSQPSSSLPAYPPPPPPNRPTQYFQNPVKSDENTIQVTELTYAPYTRDFQSHNRESELSPLHAYQNTSVSIANVPSLLSEPSVSIANVPSLPSEPSVPITNVRYLSNSQNTSVVEDDELLFI